MDIAKFADYQARYENTLIPVVIQEQIDRLKSGFHRVACVIDEWNQGPDLILRVTQVGTSLFALIPSVEPILEGPKNFFRDAKLFTSLLKGFRTIDQTLNLRYAWKLLVLQASSITLLAINVLSFVERFNIVPVTAIKVSLAAIPIFGILPYGGLLALSVGILSVMLILFSIDKKETLDQEENQMMNQNVAFWSLPLDLAKVEQKQSKYERNAAEINQEIIAYEAIFKEGKQCEAELKERSEKSKQLYACQKAIAELNETIASKRQAQESYAEKARQWDLLKTHWTKIDVNEINGFRQAKSEKWSAKLQRLQFEKKANLFSMASSSCLVSKQIFTLVAAFSTRLVLPLGAHIAIEFIGTACGVTNFFMKKLLEQHKIQSVALTDYVHLP